MPSNADIYLDHVRSIYPAATPEAIARATAICAATDWDNPASALDWNNVAVVALIEAERATDRATRQARVDEAIHALRVGMGLEQGAICGAHLGMVQCLLGDRNQATETAFAIFANSVQFMHDRAARLPIALVYWPATPVWVVERRGDALSTMLLAGDGYAQVGLLVTEVLSHAAIAFYNPVGLRFLELASHLWTKSAPVYLKLGIASIMNSRWEGLQHLHHAAELAPECAPIIQTLAIAYHELGATASAGSWLEHARAACRNAHAPAWRWLSPATGIDATFVPFESAMVLAVEPSCRSIVTSVMLAEGDWFESEMEFWRTWIRQGMTVVDVGANVGVYTFSAARRVGERGRVVAIEPFSRSVQYLRESSRVNHMPQVTVCAGAASDHAGVAHLRLESASEMNEIVSDDAVTALPPGSFETVQRFTLDDLRRREGLAHVDFLKIDAEGHELAVLHGAEQLLADCAPVILYENTAGERGNPDVATHLRARGYRLFKYRPFIQQLSPADNAEDLQGVLNIIAIPAGKVHLFD